MIWYLDNLIIILIIWLVLNLFKVKNKEKWFLRLAFLEMFLFLALRATDVGTDLKNYIPYFTWYAKWPWSKVFFLDIEPGYALYNKILSCIFNNEQFFLIVTAAICLIGIYFFIKENSKNYFLSVFIYISLNFYIFLFSGLRQAIAMSIVLLSFSAIKKGKIFRFLMLIILAMLFHKTAIVFLPFIFLAYRKQDLKAIVGTLGLTGIFLIFKKDILAIVIQFVYKTYQIRDDGGYKFLFILVAVYLGAWLVRKYVLKQEKENVIWYNMLMIAIPIQALATVQGNIARIVMYYSVGLVILIPNVFYQLEKQKVEITIRDRTFQLNKYVKYIKVLCYTLLLIFYIMNVDSFPKYHLFFA